MYRKQYPNLSIDKIMQEIKQEVQKYKEPAKYIEIPSSTNACNAPSAKSLEDKSYYTIADFTQYDDREFITNLYRKILDREPDTQGMRQHLDQLHNGEHSKIEILTAIRFSKEGKSKNVKVLGIKKRRFIAMLYHIPVIGYISKTLITLLTLPKLLKRLNYLESYMTINRLGVQKNAHDTIQFGSINKTEFDTLRDSLHSNIDTKVDKTSFETLSSNLYANIDTKVDKTSFETLSSNLYANIDTKVDKSGLTPYSRRVNYTKKQTNLSQKSIQNFVDEAKERATVYLPYVEALPFKKGKIKILDVSCGRGEWIELLSDQGYKAQGIDLNRIMVNISKELGLDAEEADIVEYLQSLEDESLSVITGFHIIEHLPFEVLMKMYDEALRVLRLGGMVILETPNPEYLIVGACNFYTDLADINTISPSTVKLILNNIGFSNIEIKSLHSNNDNATSILETPLKIFFTEEQDYALIGYKT